MAWMQEVDSDIKSRVVHGQVGAESYLAGDYYRCDAAIMGQRALATSATSRATDPTTRLAAAQLVYTVWRDESDLRHKEWRAAGILFWSKKVLEGELSAAKNAAARLRAVEFFLQRTKEIEKFVEDLRASPPPSYVHELKRDAARAELMLLDEKGGTSGPDRSKVCWEWLGRAKDAYEADWTWTTRTKNTLYLEPLYEESCEWRLAALEQASTREERIAANQGHLKRMLQIAQIVASQDSASSDLWAVEYYVSQARLWLSLAAASTA